MRICVSLTFPAGWNQGFPFWLPDYVELITGRQSLTSKLESFGAFSPGAVFWLAKRQFRPAGKTQNREAASFQ
jgi:hypothetical protein